ncbi:Isoprenoid synthase domain containing protein [Amanita muscaria]
MLENLAPSFHILESSRVFWNWLKCSLGFGPSFIVPDIISHCTYPVRLNPHHEEQSQASLQWLAASLAKTENLSQYSKAKLGQLISLVHPNADALRLRICIDYMNYVFWLDDKLEDLDVEGNRRLEEYCMAAMRDPVHYRTDVPEAILTKSWCSRLEQASSTAFKDRFMQTFLEYLQGVRNQVEVRAQDRIADIEEYMAIRLHSSGVIGSLTLAEFCGGYYLPDHVYHHPIIRSLRLAAGEHVFLVNDLVSYEKEVLARGDHHNLISVAMKTKGFSLQEAVDFVGKKINDCIDRFERDRKMVPLWDSETDTNVADLVAGYEYWMSGHLHWAFTSGRYLGAIKDMRVVKLRQ